MTDDEPVPLDGDELDPPSWVDKQSYKMEVLLVRNESGHSFRLMRHTIVEDDNYDAAISSDVICPLSDNL